jgi:hypothetical protein
MLWSLSALISVAWAGPSDLLGVWANDTGKIEVSGDSSGHNVRMVLRDDLVQEGPVREEDGQLQAAMEGCGAVFKLTDQGRLEVDLNGPECPIELIGEYALSAAPKDASHCADIARSEFHCLIPDKKGGAPKRLEVCKLDDGALRYQYGRLGNVELALNNGKAGARDLASGSEYTFDFENDGYAYSVFVVESSRAADTGAGVAVSKGGKTVATLSCGDDEWFRATSDGASTADQVCCKNIHGPFGDPDRFDMRLTPRDQCETTTAEIGTANECAAYAEEVICCATQVSRGEYTYSMNQAGACFRSVDNKWASADQCD